SLSTLEVSPDTALLDVALGLDTPGLTVEDFEGGAFASGLTVRMDGGTRDFVELTAHTGNFGFPSVAWDGARALENASAALAGNGFDSDVTFQFASGVGIAGVGVGGRGAPAPIEVFVNGSVLTTLDSGTTGWPACATGHRRPHGPGFAQTRRAASSLPGRRQCRSWRHAMSDHRIERVRVHRIKIPTKAVHSHGSGDISAIHSVILELTTDSGITGWGEASPWPVFTGTAEANAAALDVYLRPVMMGCDPVQVERHLASADRLLTGHPEAKAAMEMALLDVAGRIAALSVSELVGGRMRDHIGLSFSVANPDFAQDLEDIAALWDDGVRLYKLKTGFADHRFDLMRLETLRKTYGDEIDLRVDYNQGLPAYDAVRQLRDVESFRPTFIEQPVKMHERAALAAITAALDAPVMADESVFDPRTALAGAHARIADIFSLKIMKSGGIRRALEVAAIARAAGIDVYGGCMFETGVAHLAGTHLMAAVPDLRLECEFYMATYYAEYDILAEPFPVEAGRINVPTTPGLGISVDREKLARAAVAPVLG
ncbi:MAG: enolase C-terminal domain-like protein, partial [Pseudomonadota bacterium]